MNTQQNTTPTGTAKPAQPGRRRRLALAAGLTIGTIGAVAGGVGGSASAIIDGEDTNVSEIPWQVALVSSDGTQFCGGTIVSDRVIVTAAHCTQGTSEGDIVVRAGVSDLTTSDGQTRNVTSVVEHPKYETGVGDIAMLVLDTPLDLSNTVQVIQLATAADIASADTARVTGWGVTDENADDTPSVLQSTDVPLISDADCSLVDEGNDDELCAGGTGTDSCYGDSGGPLTIATQDGPALAGVVSWGEECGDNLGGVYAEVPTFATWVAERVADPDAPVGDRLPTPDDGGEFEEFEFEDGEFEEFEFEEFDQEFIDLLGDEFDTLPDDEFWDRYDDYVEQNGSSTDDGDTFDDDISTDDPGNAAVDIDSMTDAEFQDYIDDLSNDDFDQLLQEWDVTDVTDTPGNWDHDDTDWDASYDDSDWDADWDDSWDDSWDAEYADY